MSLAATILVVDDRAVNRRFLSTLFAYRGYRVVEAADGAAALALARESGVDLIFSDILMPGMDGVELAKRVRGEAALAHIPLIFYTATYRSTDARKLAAGCGVQEVLAKPSDPAVILETVARYLGGSTRPFPQTATADLPRPSGQVVERLSSYIGDLSELEGRLAAVIEDGKRLIGRGGDLHELSYQLSDAFTTLHTISLRLSAVIELGIEVACEPDPRQLVELCCRGAQDILSARRAAVGILRDDRSELEHLSVPGSRGKPPPWLEPWLPASDILAEVVASGSARIVRATGTTPARLAVPVKSPQRTYGWAYFEGTLGSNDFSAEDEHFAMTLAAQLGLSYENLKRYNQAQSRFLHLLEREAEWQQAQRIVKLAHVVIGDNGSIERWSDTLPQLLGTQSDEIPRSTRGWLRFVHASDRHRVWRELVGGTARKGQKRIDVCYRARLPDGRLIVINHVSEPLDSAALSGVNARRLDILQDVTHWHAANHPK